MFDIEIPEYLRRSEN